MNINIAVKMDLLRIDEYEGAPIEKNIIKTRWLKIMNPIYDENGTMILNEEELKNLEEATTEEVEQYLKGKEVI